MRQTWPTALPLALFLAACSGGSQPAGPTPPSTTAPAPAPAPTATPQPTPTPPASVTAKCTLGKSETQGCQKETRDNGQDRTIYYEEIQKAIRDLRVEKPGLFDGHKIRNERTFMAGVYLQLLADGYCAEVGPSPDEISIKQGTNTFSEVYDIIFSEGKSATTDYINTCRPAHF